MFASSCECLSYCNTRTVPRVSGESVVKAMVTGVEKQMNKMTCLDNLCVDTLDPSLYYVPSHNGTGWIPSSIVLSNINDVSNNTPQINDTLKWNGTQWAPGTIDSLISTDLPLFEIAKANSSNESEIGVFGKYIDGGLPKYTGYYWNPNTNKFSFVYDVQADAATQSPVNVSNGILGTVVGNFETNTGVVLSGNNLGSSNNTVNIPNLKVSTTLDVEGATVIGINNDPSTDTNASLFEISRGNTGNDKDIGVYGKYIKPADITRYCGYYWSHITEKFMFFYNVEVKPGTDDPSNGSLRNQGPLDTSGNTLGTIIANFETFDNVRFAGNSIELNADSSLTFNAGNVSIPKLKVSNSLDTTDLSNIQLSTPGIINTVNNVNAITINNDNVTINNAILAGTTGNIIMDNNATIGTTTTNNLIEINDTGDGIKINGTLTTSGDDGNTIGDIIVPDGGTVGSVSKSDAMTIAADGNVSFVNGATVTGATVINGPTTSITGSTTMTGAVSLNGSTQLNGSLSINGNSIASVGGFTIDNQDTNSITSIKLADELSVFKVLRGTESIFEIKGDGSFDIDAGTLSNKTFRLRGALQVDQGHNIGTGLSINSESEITQFTSAETNFNIKNTNTNGLIRAILGSNTNTSSFNVLDNNLDPAMVLSGDKNLSLYGDIILNKSGGTTIDNVSDDIVNKILSTKNFKINNGTDDILKVQGDGNIDIGSNTTNDSALTSIYGSTLFRNITTNSNDAYFEKTLNIGSNTFILDNVESLSRITCSGGLDFNTLGNVNYHISGGNIKHFNINNYNNKKVFSVSSDGELTLNGGSNIHPFNSNILSLKADGEGHLGQEGFKFTFKGDVQVDGTSSYSQPLELVAPQGGAAELIFKADEGDDTNDIWKIGVSDGGPLNIYKYNGSTYDTLFDLATAGQLGVPGGFGVGSSNELSLTRDSTGTSSITNTSGDLVINNTSSSHKTEIKTTDFVVNNNTGGMLMSLTSSGIGVLGGQLLSRLIPSVITGVTTEPYTAANVLSGLILRTPDTGGNTDTLPTATDIVNAIPNCEQNTSFQLIIKNTSNVSTDTITLRIPPTNGGITLDSSSTINSASSKVFIFIVTNVTAPAVTVHSIMSAPW